MIVGSHEYFDKIDSELRCLFVMAEDTDERVIEILFGEDSGEGFEPFTTE